MALRGSLDTLYTGRSRTASWQPDIISHRYYLVTVDHGQCMVRRSSQSLNVVSSGTCVFAASDDSQPSCKIRVESVLRTSQCFSLRL